MVRILIGAAAILAMVATPAAAQMAMSPFKHQEKRLTPAEVEQQKQRDKDYKAAMDKIPEKKAGDPWGGIRDASPTTTKTKP